MVGVHELGGVVHRGLRGHVQLHCPDVEPAKLGDRGRAPLGIARTQQHRPALLGQPAGNGETDSLVRPGHHGDRRVRHAVDGAPAGTPQPGPAQPGIADTRLRGLPRGMLDGVDRSELGAALKDWRARLTPGDVGLPAGTRRRTPGLRREEVAQLAGMSVDYLTRLEQGRGPRPSESVLGALTRALRLSDAERDHLFHLSGGTPPPAGRISDTVRPSVLRLMDRFTDLPAMLLNARADVLAWNPMAAALLGDFSAVPPARRNIAWQRFAGAGPGRLIADGDERERLDRAAVADLRAAAARYPDDPRLRRMISELRTRSPEFARLWALRSVEPRHADRKRFAHPQLGVLELDCDALAVPGDDQVLIVYSATPGSPEAEALALLRVLGVEPLAATGVHPELAQPLVEQPSGGMCGAGPGNRASSTRRY